MKLINLKIINPSGIFLETQSDLVTIETLAGFRGFQYGIAPIFSIIKNGQVWINSSWSKNQKKYWITSGIVYGDQKNIFVIAENISESKNDVNKNIIHENKIKSLNENYNMIQKKAKIKKNLAKSRKNN
ncbi:hypothetical protein [[Mycoplasma] collis]|uniref:hypothetical protein n=1 Tax=[Mycoplasma] collis TaxID=2127 RepID=UPI00051C18FF|nr:hypothetical protein [[Mycoplasma] collis]